MAGIRSRLLEWGVGQRTSLDAAATSDTYVVVLESAEHLEPLLASDLVGANSTVLVPSGSTADPGQETGPQSVESSGSEGPVLQTYQGCLAEVGSEFNLNDTFFLQIQAYGVSEYMSVVGPTLIRVAGADDFETYLHDADNTWRTGRFPEAMINPVIHLADISALGAQVELDGPSVRLFIDRTGAISVSPAGLPLGQIGTASAGSVLAAWYQGNASRTSSTGSCQSWESP